MISQLPPLRHHLVCMGLVAVGLALALLNTFGGMPNA